ncbi:hypothetical protein N9294_02115 [bacterium]|nr:hypothetical protein [Akkermansiaceae bacterium]MDB4422738.1 hypothetical protein [bacterium]
MKTAWRIEAFYDGNGTPIVRVESPVTSAFLYQINPCSEIGSDYGLLAMGSIIGPEVETTNLQFRTPRINGSAPFAVGFPLPDLTEGTNNFIGETAYLGFRFQGGGRSSLWVCFVYGHDLTGNDSFGDGLGK